MIVKCVHYDVVQDKNDSKNYFEPNKKYEVTAERGAELINSGYFEALEGVTEEQVQAVAKAIVETAAEQEETIEEVVNEIVEEEATEEVEEEKPKKTTKKSTK